jgi:DNA-binding response OmpR family regulator
VSITPPAGRTEARRLLVVDDEPEVRELVLRQLSRRGFECTQASNAERALDLLAACEFDGVLLDLHMPGIGGLGLLEAVRRQSGDVALVVVTGSQDSSDAIAALKLGADEYVRKPFDAETLLASLGRALDKRDTKMQTQNRQLHVEEVASMTTSPGTAPDIQPVWRER